MATEPTGDHWTSEAYQNAAAFVPKLASKVLQWLDVQKDDVILDVGCGDGVLDVEMAKVLARGAGRVHGIDSSAAMISAAQEAARKAGLADRCSFQVLDAARLPRASALQSGAFTKAFSNAALHWILRPPPDPAGSWAAVFDGVRGALAPGGTFVFEMGGLGNIAEIRAALLAAVARRLPGGVAQAREADPWFFPDERWVRETMEERVGGWKVERVEREWRPTEAERAGGVEGWVRLMGKKWFEALPEEEQEACVKEVVEVLEEVCRQPGGGWMLGYVRLRAVARKI
ncbi:hypothetical protein VTJ83DRAFT_342 [Remersonia thermophila]|uniref:Methyltransferase domain-containing protein n=1 Tax=Remersonia thermophila TaxID=72144 RepID=A0ABR4DL35_9PEZI